MSTAANAAFPLDSVSAEQPILALHESAVYDPCLGRDDGFRSRRIVEVVNDKRAIANCAADTDFLRGKLHPM
jgi:hypothetical protein